jgi:hypothetical protein
VPCPSAADPGRKTHRTGAGWTLGTVTTILENPRYTGRQVWNRQRTDTELADPANVTLGHKSVQRWNLPGGWVISRRLAHPALVSEDDFVAAQGISARVVRYRKMSPCSAGTCWPGCLPAGCAGGGWNLPGPTAKPRTGAGTAVPARWRPARPGRRTPISARTSCFRTCPPCICFSPPPPRGPGAGPEPEPTYRAR